MERRGRTRSLGEITLAVFLLLEASGGTVEAQNKCAGDKIKAACKKASCKAALEAKQAQRGGTVDPAKVAKCEATFSKSFAKSEAKGGCATTGDAAAIEAKVDAFVLDLDTELNVLTGSHPNTCEGEKLKAAAKKASCKCSLEAKQAAKGGTIDPAKVAKCESYFSKSFAKSEAKGGCNTTADAAAIEGKVDAFVTDVDAELPSVPTTSTSTTSSTSTSTTTSTPTTTLVCGTFLTKWGSSGSGDGQFSFPHGVAVDGSGNVFVGEEGNARIQKFTDTGTFLTKWGSPGSGDGQFDTPWGVAVDGSGHVFVADYANNRIQKFTDTGTFLTKWGSHGSGDGQFSAPTGVAVDGSGHVFVAEQLNDRIQKFTDTGTFLTKWGSSGSGDGQFNFPHDVAVDGGGNVFVTDSQNNRVQKFTDTGTFLTKWGSSGSGDGQFNFPRGVAVDGSGHVFVADNNRIQKFTDTGTFLTKWGSSGSGDGQFNIPFGVAVDGGGNVFVADWFNHRIQKFACP
jgi:streptogramin lyase